MGQKINPIGLRLGINRTWDSRWFAGKAEYGKLLHEDVKIREILHKELKQAAVARIVIERPHKKCRVTIHSARPGVVIGKKGADIDKLRKKVAEITDSDVVINIVEIRKPELDATLVAESIAQQLEHTLRADIDYGVATAFTTFGTCGVKVWIFKGEILEHDPMAQDKKMAEGEGSRPRRDAA
jgi:small subunit ribosomal protein S3